MSLLLTLASATATDSFQRANESPLNPANWGTIPSQDSLQIVSDQVTTDSTLVGGNIWIGNNLPNNQYASTQIKSWSNISTSQSLLETFVRAQRGANTYYIFDVAAPGQNDGVNCLAVMGGLLNNSVIFIQQMNIPAIQIGDVFTGAVVGSNLYFLRNGSIFMQATDNSNSIVGGSAAFIISSNSVGDTGVIDFAAGAASLANVAPFVDAWGVRSEYCLIDPTGASQNSNAPFPTSPEANILTSDDPKTKIIPFNGGTILFKNPA